MDVGSSSKAVFQANNGSGDSLNVLKFGKYLYLRDIGNTSIGGSSSVTLAMASPPQQKQNLLNIHRNLTPPCQVEGCNDDLRQAKSYYCKHKVCVMHSKSPTAVVGGIEQRFCQQCSSLLGWVLPSDLSYFHDHSTQDENVKLKIQHLEKYLHSPVKYIKFWFFSKLKSRKYHASIASVTNLLRKDVHVIIKALQASKRDQPLDSGGGGGHCIISTCILSNNLLKIDTANLLCKISDELNKLLCTFQSSVYEHRVYEISSPKAQLVLFWQAAYLISILVPFDKYFYLQYPSIIYIPGPFSNT